MSKMHLFYGGPFSQWYSSKFIIESQVFTQAEQYMMFKKAELFGDEEMARRIMGTDSPRDQKAFGKLVAGFNKDTWEAVARDIVFRGNMAKFTQNPDLRDYILETGDDIIVEASPYDVIWGIGLAEDNPLALDQSNWRGKNWLGDVCMAVRDAIRKSIPEEQEMRSCL